MKQATQSIREAEVERLIRALQQHVGQGTVPEVLRQLTTELEKLSGVEQRCAELFESEQLARSEVREQQAANKAKDRFLAVLSHELRTPLQPILAAASALLRDPRLPPDLLEDVRTVQRNVQLEARLIDDLIDLTRIMNGKLSLEPVRVNMESLIARAVEICEPDVMLKRLMLSMQLNANRTWVMGDPGRMQQVLWNLIKNAVKFTPVGGEITIETTDAPGNRLVVRVIDTGIGIKPESLPRIFDAFEQADEQIVRQFGGLGLGLAISKVLVERHYGTLDADSAGLNHGSTFTLTLPTVDASPPVAPPVAPPRTPLARKPVHILLVEDDDATMEIMTRLLASFGHTILPADDCATTRAIAASNEFDLLICDIGLPDGSGLDLIREIARDGMKSIALTGYGAESDVQQSLAAGFDRHLTKPVTLGQLVAVIDELFP